MFDLLEAIAENKLFLPIFLKLENQTVSGGGKLFVKLVVVDVYTTCFDENLFGFTKLGIALHFATKFEQLGEPIFEKSYQNYNWRFVSPGVLPTFEPLSGHF